MTAATTIDSAKLETFVNKVVGDMSGTYSSIMCTLGDRLGLFKELDAHGPAMSGELAARASINERYAREWLSALACAGYLDYAPETQRFTLPPEHAMVLAQEAGPAFFGGMYQELPALLGILDLLTDAFRTGGGVSQEAYHPGLWEGMERLTASWFENLLIPEWIPAVPDLPAKLEQGASVADIGCGNGRAVIKLAQAFPASHFVGYDLFASPIAKATATARECGVSDRVRFVRQDVAAGLPEQYDLITTLDVVHDMVDPAGALRAIRAALKPDGRYVMMEFNYSDKLEENIGPLGALGYSSSVLYCMTTSLAHGGAGLGAMGLPEPKVRELCAEAGFSKVDRLPIENPFNVLYDVKP